MAQAFGHNSWIGFAEETTYGTAVAPTKFLEITDDKIKGEQSRIAKPTLRSPSRKFSVRSKRSVGGSFGIQMPFEGAELMLKHAMGAVSSNLVVAGVYLHTFTFSSNLPTGLTFHANRDATNIGGNAAFQYTGCQIDSLSLKQNLEDLLLAEVGVIGQDWGNVAVATPTFPTFKQIDWEMVSISTINGVIYPIESLELTIKNNLAKDRYKLGSRLRNGLGRAGVREVTGKVVFEFDSLTAVTLFQNLTQVNAQFDFTGPVISGAFNYNLSVVLPRISLRSGEPEVSDAGPIKLEVEFDALALTDNAEFAALFLHNTLPTIG